MSNTSQFSPANTSRRNLVKKLGQALGALIIALLAWPIYRFSRFTIPPKPHYKTVPAPLPISGFHAEKDFLLFDMQVTGTKPVAVSRTCTHLGCRIQYHEDKGYIECPCHQSRFTPEGQVIRGPAQKNLPVYPVELRKDEQGTVTAYVITH